MPSTSLKSISPVHHGAGELLEWHLESAGGVAQGQQRLIHRALLLQPQFTDENKNLVLDPGDWRPEVGSSESVPGLQERYEELNGLLEVVADLVGRLLHGP